MVCLANSATNKFDEIKLITFKKTGIPFAKKQTNKQTEKKTDDEENKNRQIDLKKRPGTYSLLVYVPSDRRTIVFGKSLQSEPGAVGM